MRSAGEFWASKLGSVCVERSNDNQLSVKQRPLRNRKFASVTIPCFYLSMGSKSILLKSGLALVHDEQDHINPIKADILIQDGKIAAIEPTISPLEGTEIVDCTDKIVSPGFVSYTVMEMQRVRMLDFANTLQWSRLTRITTYGRRS